MKLKRLFIAVLAGAWFGPATAVVAEETNRWSFDVVPYLWVASAELESQIFPGERDDVRQVGQASASLAVASCSTRLGSCVERRTVRSPRRSASWRSSSSAPSLSSAV